MTQYQFELWEECNQQCSFCYLGERNRHTPDEKKLHNLVKTKETILDKSLYTEKGIDCLAYIGGEFFQGQLNTPEIKEKFLEIMKITSDLISNGTLKETWICATLTRENQSDLYETLDLFSDKSKVWILTSYDTIGRFHIASQYQNWKHNIHLLRNKFPDLKMNCTSIITEDFIDKYLNDDLEVISFLKRHDVTLFLKPAYGIRSDEFDNILKQDKDIPNFFPTRKKFLAFLFKYKHSESEFMYDKLFNIEYRSEYLETFTDGNDNLNHRIKDSSQESHNNELPILPCGHSSQYAIYIDEPDKCVICDKERIKNR